MTEPTIICPNCKTEIKLTELLALRAQEFTTRVDFNDYERALAQLRAANAFLEPHEGWLRMPHSAIASR